MVHQLIYGSAEVRPLGVPELAELLRSARQANQQLGITGMLLYYDHSFLQVLEGEREPVEALFRKITADARHRGVVVFSRGTVEERAFGEWSMAFHAPAAGGAAIDDGFRDIRKLPPEELASPKVRALVASFRKMTRLQAPGEAALLP